MLNLISAAPTMLKEKVAQWLETTGFPLEMATARAFRAAGFQIRQSTLYDDPESGKSREIDVLAIHQDGIGIIQISYVLECKSSKRPWLVLTSEDAWESFNRLSMYAVMSKPAIRCFGDRISDKDIQAKISRPSQGGYGLRQAFADGGDAAYTACCSVTKAAASISQSDRRAAASVYSFAFPIIIVDSPIFECSLLDNGDLDLREVTRSELLFTMSSPSPIATCIKIVHISVLEQFALEAQQTAQKLRHSLRNEQDKWIAGER